MTGPAARNAYTRKQTLRPYELAALCRVDPSTVRRWRREGKLPCLQTLGGHPRYLRRDLDFLPAHGDPQLLTYADFAALMAVNRKTVCEWALKGRLTSVILPGGYPRLIASEIVSLLAGDSR